MRYLIYILILLICFSCRSKKKITERISEDKKEISSQTIEEKKEAVIDTDIRSNGVKITTSFTKDKTATFKQADPSKIIYINDGNSTYEVKGADFSFSEKEETNKIIDSFQSIIKIKEKQISDLKRSNESLSKSHVKGRKSDSDAKGVSVGLWIWLIFFIVLVFILWRLGILKD